DDEDDYRTTPIHSPHLSPVLSSHPPPSSLPPPLLPNPRKASHGRFHVTEHVLEPAAEAAYPVGDGDAASQYAAMAAGGGNVSTVSHSRVGRFAVMDEQH